MTVAIATSPPASVEAARSERPTIWGLDATSLHDAWWRAHGVQCVRRGTGTAPERHADLYLLLEPGTLVIFDPTSLVERLTWHGALLTRLRVLDAHEPPYGERVVLDDDGRVERIARRYRARTATSARAILTTRSGLATRWTNAASGREGWRSLRRRVSWSQLDHARVSGLVAGRDDPDDATRLVNDLVDRWADPAQVVDGVAEIRPGIWAPRDTTLPDDLVTIGPLWIGGVPAPSVRCLIGPDWLADDAASPPIALRSIADVAPRENAGLAPAAARRPVYPVIKRAMDVTASALALIGFLPAFALIALWIALEDGRPVFFRHRRQGRGGRTFSCLKFRTMHRDAERIARQLEAYNVCDGPQVYIRDDPRVTRIGRMLRSAHLDELPQFWNVLIGDMSLVGPRPSPADENRYCPAWRDARLSVRPGITGLWQLERRRLPGEDFQEWIRYDLEYVHTAGLRLDLQIMWRTLKLMVLGRA